MLIDVAYEASHDEQIEAQMALAELSRPSVGDWRSILKGSILASTLAGSGALITTKTFSGFVFAFLVFAFMAALMLVASRSAREAHMRRLLRTRLKVIIPKLIECQEHRYGIGEDGIRDQCSCGESFTSWSGISYSLPLENQLVLRLKNGGYLLFARRAFNEQQWAEFNALLKDRLGSAD